MNKFVNIIIAFLIVTITITMILFFVIDSVKKNENMNNSTRKIFDNQIIVVFFDGTPWERVQEIANELGLDRINAPCSGRNDVMYVDNSISLSGRVTRIDGTEQEVRDLCEILNQYDEVDYAFPNFVLDISYNTSDGISYDF